MNRTTLASGALLAMTAVIFGALGAHYLKTILTPELQSSFETGVRYQFYHGTALILLGIYAQIFNRKVDWVFRLMLTGVLFFSVSIYVLCLLKSNGIIGIKGLGLITPLGGVFMICSWILWLRDMFRLSLR